MIFTAEILHKVERRCLRKEHQYTFLLETFHKKTLPFAEKVA